MKLTLPQRAMLFSQEQKDILEAGLELYKHYLHDQDPVRYAKFSKSTQDMSYDEKNAEFNVAFRKAVMKRAYLPETAVEDKNIFKMKSVRDMAFVLVSEVLDTILPEVIIDSFRRVAEVSVIGKGNTKTFGVPNKKNFVVNKVSRGTRMTEPQRLYKGDSILIPEPRMITIKENFEEILMGRVDWGQLITRASESFEIEVTTEIYTTIANTYSTLETNFKEAGFSQSAFVSLAQRIEAMNRAGVVVMGTKVALQSILPSNDHLKEALGSEYNTYGYIRNFMGVDLMEIPQTITPNTTDFAISNNELYFFSLGTDKPIKMAMEDGGMMIESTDIATFADGTYFQSIQKAWDLAVITSAKHGIMRIA
jgi:hypothetical protein